MLGCVERSSARAALALAGVGAVLIVLMMLQVMVDVVSRFLFALPLPGTIEIVSHYYMVGATFLPLALVQVERGHFAAETLRSLMPRRLNVALDGVNGLVVAAATSIIAWKSCGTAIDATEINEQVQLSLFVIPTWPSRWALPISFALMAVIALAGACRDFGAAAGRAGAGAER
jgi:TRAP-type C4-dicarboxylate transport system permease small subunit